MGLTILQSETMQSSGIIFDINSTPMQGFEKESAKKSTFVEFTSSVRLINPVHSQTKANYSFRVSPCAWMPCCKFLLQRR